MINVITKKRFYSLYNNSGFNKFCNISLGIKKCKLWKDIDLSNQVYYEKSEKVFIYIENLDTVLIPVDSELNINDISSDLIDFSDWKIEKISDKILEPKYTLNRFKVCSGYSGFLDEDKHMETGTWKAVNSRTEEEIDFSTKFCDDSWNKATYIAFPEKLEFPIDKILINKKEMFLYNIVIWNLKK